MRTRMGCEVMKEARVMQLYDYPNIVKFYGFVLDDHPYLLVLQLCHNGAVEDALKTRQHKLSIKYRINYTLMAACGMEYLHKKECIHRDIGARNCLIHKGVVKIADFGMCRAQTVYKLDMKKPCNVRWLAPEVWDNSETRFSTDVYAFGIIIWEFFIKPYKCPYDDMRAAEVKRKTRAGYRLPVPSKMPQPVADIMEECWHHSPEKRLSAEKMKERLEEARQIEDDRAEDGRTKEGELMIECC
uniref:Protein kinase domain-containing protein n=1 Tax=Caenorhabditis japonica TaxID=281687 RepID=A0A8R1HRZ2_CAEJA